MSQFNDEFLDNLSTAIWSAIAGDDFFLSASVMVLEHKHGVLANDIDEALNVLGLSVRVGMPELVSSTSQSPGGRFITQTLISVDEMPSTNNTGITCAKAALNVIRLMHNFAIGPLHVTLTLASAPEEVKDDMAGIVQRIIKVQCEYGMTGLGVRRVVRPTISRAGNAVLAETSTAGATVRCVAWTGDTMPALPAEADSSGTVDGVTRFAGVHTFTEAVKIMARGFREGLTGSHVEFYEFEPWMMDSDNLTMDSDNATFDAQ